MYSFFFKQVNQIFFINRQLQNNKIWFIIFSIYFLKILFVSFFWKYGIFVFISAPKLFESKANLPNVLNSWCGVSLPNDGCCASTCCPNGASSCRSYWPHSRPWTRSAFPDSHSRFRVFHSFGDHAGSSRQELVGLWHAPIYYNRISL